MNGGAWGATVCWVAKSWTRFSDWVSKKRKEKKRKNGRKKEFYRILDAEDNSAL